jgi:hypothetical protein
MILKDRVIDHTKSNLHEAMSIPSYMRTKCRERIFFASFSNALQRTELFEDEDDAPSEMTTVTGDLQRCLQLITDPLEYEYTILTFFGHQRMAMEVYGRYKFLQESGNSKEDKLKMSILNLVEQLKNKDEDDEEEDDVDNLNSSTLLKRISIVKESHYNFDTYLKLVIKKLSSRGDSDFNIDDLLKDVLN